MKPTKKKCCANCAWCEDTMAYGPWYVCLKHWNKNKGCSRNYMYLGAFTHDKQMQTLYCDKWGAKSK